MIEITLTTIAAYGSFLIAEQFHASGIISALTAGLTVGNIGWGAALSDESKNRVRYAWEYFAFLANSFVFILIGMNAASLPLRQLGWTGAIAILLVLAGRALSIYPLGDAFRRVALAAPGVLSAYFVLGRSARRARSGPGAGASADRRRARRDHRHRLCRRGLLDPGPGPDHAVR